jgi:hypothetical protein
MAQAYNAPMNPVPSNPNSQMFNQPLENQVSQQGGNIPLHPVVQQLMKSAGLLSMLRNRGNDQMQEGQY